MQRVPVQRAEAVQGGDSLRASAHRPAYQPANAARKALSAYQSSATASTPNSPSATSRRDAPAREPSSAWSVFNSSSARGRPRPCCSRWRCIASGGQLVQFGRQRLIASAGCGAGANGIGVSHAVDQAGSDHQPQAAARPACQQHGAYRRGSGASGRGGARMRRPPRRAAGRRPGRAAPPHRDRGTRPDARRAHPGRIFQQAQSPARAASGRRRRQPVAAVVGVAAQVFPGQRGAVEVQREIRGGRIPCSALGSAMTQPPVVQQASPRIPPCGSYRAAIKSSSKSG